MYRNTGMFLDKRCNNIHMITPIIAPFFLNNLCGIIRKTNDSININEKEDRILIFVQKFSGDTNSCSACGDSINRLDIISNDTPIIIKTIQYLNNLMNFIESENLFVRNIIIY